MCVCVCVCVVCVIVSECECVCLCVSVSVCVCVYAFLSPETKRPRKLPILDRQTDTDVTSYLQTCIPFLKNFIFMGRKAAALHAL